MSSSKAWKESSEGVLERRGGGEEEEVQRDTSLRGGGTPEKN